MNQVRFCIRAHSQPSTASDIRRDEWGTVGAEWREVFPNYACGEAWSGETQGGFAKMLLFEMGFDGYIGVYQVVNGSSGIPRKICMCKPEDVREQGTVISILCLEPKGRTEECNRFST